MDFSSYLCSIASISLMGEAGGHIVREVRFRIWTTPTCSLQYAEPKTND